MTGLPPVVIRSAGQRMLTLNPKPLCGKKTRVVVISARLESIYVVVTGKISVNSTNWNMTGHPPAVTLCTLKECLTKRSAFVLELGKYVMGRKKKGEVFISVRLESIYVVVTGKTSGSSTNLNMTGLPPAVTRSTLRECLTKRSSLVLQPGKYVVGRKNKILESICVVGDRKNFCIKCE